MRLLSPTLVAAGVLAAGPALAADTLDLGVLRASDLSVVQKMLYPKVERTELGVHLGIMPLDAYLITPNLQLTLDRHLSESVSVGVIAGGGYGLKSGTYRLLESPTFSVAPYAYRYLASALGGVQWSPVYAKLNWSGAQVIHFDVYGAARAGVTVEQSVLPDASLTLAPTVSPAIGARMWLSERTTLRLEVRDDFLVERRALTQTWNLKNNANVQVGMTFFSPKPAERK